MFEIIIRNLFEYSQETLILEEDLKRQTQNLLIFQYIFKSFTIITHHLFIFNNK